jgi:DNA adenine methylase
MIYCSFNGSLERNNEYHVGSLYTNLYYNRSCHIFTENYFTKLVKLSKFLQKGKIYNKDYKQILSQAKKGDFVFIDPPYIEDKPYAFKYNKNESLFDIDTLVIELKKLDKKGIKWMMTQMYTPEIQKLFSGYYQVIYINKLTFANKNQTNTEVIIMNYHR